MIELLEYGIRLLWLLLEVISLGLTAEAFLPKERKPLLWLLWPIVGACVLLKLPSVWLAPIWVAAAVIWAVLSMPGKKLSALGAAVLSCTLGTGLDVAVCILVSLLTGVRFSDPQWQNLLYIVALTASRLLHLLAAFLFCRLRRPDTDDFIRSKGLFLSLLFPALSLLLVVAEYQAYRISAGSSGSAILTCCALILGNVAVLYLLRRAEKHPRQDADLTLLHKQMELQTQSILSLEKSYRLQRKTAHEFRHHLQTLRDLLEREETAAAKDYIAQLEQTHSTRVLCVNTRHPIVDAVLNQKYQAAAERSIDLQLQVNDLSGLKLDPEALVVVLTNLLDNAIEGCQRLNENRSIRCTLLAEENLFLSVTNTAPEVRIQENAIKSTKMPPEDHGFGLPAVCSILNQLKGEYAFDYEDGWFRFVAEIPLD